jgi:HAD superfamily hydrolase (TIGR01490 family)
MNKAGCGSNIAAIFDLDGTLFTGHLWQGIITHHLKHGVKLPSTLFYLAAHYFLWIGNKLKILSEESYKTKWGEDLALLLKGFTGEDMMRVFKWIDMHYFSSRLRPDMVEVLRQHRQLGRITFILSGSFQDFLEVVKERLGAEHVVGTKLEIAKGQCTGRIEKPLCFGINKVGQLKQSFSQMNLDINLEASFAYADSLIDLPVLEMVGNPVASYPDKGLVNLARERSWKILPC